LLDAKQEVGARFSGTGHTTTVRDRPCAQMATGRAVVAKAIGVFLMPLLIAGCGGSSSSSSASSSGQWGNVCVSDFAADYADISSGAATSSSTRAAFQDAARDSRSGLKL
jgi:hypothetical protein